MKKILLLIGISLLVFMACDEAPEEGTPLSEIPIDGDGDINGDDVADVGGGMHLGSGILDEDGKLDGDFSDDGDDEWSDGVNFGLPKWSIGDKRTIKIDQNGDNWILDYNDNLTSELDPTRTVLIDTLFAKEAAYYFYRNSDNTSMLIQSAFKPTGNEADPSECYINRKIISYYEGDGGEDDELEQIWSQNYKGSPFFIDVPADQIILSNEAIRTSTTISYKFISPTTGKEKIISYTWKGKFTPQTGHHEVQLVGYIMNGREIGNTSPQSPYIPI